MHINLQSQSDFKKLDVLNSNTPQNNTVKVDSSSITLRPYQKECIDSIQQMLSKGTNRVLCSLATGAGKTIIFANLIKELGKRALILVHTHELQKQAEEKIKMILPKACIGFVNAECKEFDQEIVIATIQAAQQPYNLAALEQQLFSVLIFDECHHAVTPGASDLLKKLDFGPKTDKKLIGFTATAFRADGKGLGEAFDAIAYEKTTKELIAEGWLVRPQGFKVATNLDLSRVKKENGDLQAASLSTVMNTPVMNGLVVDAYVNNAAGLKAICFAVNVQHAHDLAQTFNNRGIAAAVVHGKMPTIERENILRDYKEGDLKILTNCAVLTEGFDAPETSCIIMARPTQSLGLYQQMVGRGLRKFPNKNSCIVIDFNERNHSICNVALLLKDAELHAEQGNQNRKQQVKIPAKLNPKLKTALRTYDPLGETFLWNKTDGGYSLQGTSGENLAIETQFNGLYRIAFYKHQRKSIVAQDLNFDYAFGQAEELAKANRKLFVFADKEAKWRNEPITDRQKDVFKRFGYKAGIDKLTRGQASFVMTVMFNK